jgi:hypothetical protein
MAFVWFLLELLLIIVVIGVVSGLLVSWLQQPSSPRRPPRRR